MIPKIIHYCWLSSNNIDDKFQDCIDTWKGVCNNEYEFHLWGPECVEEFCRTSKFFKKYWDLKNYAYCADFVRFYALYHYGGLYLDCDVKLYENFNRVLHLKRYIGLECWECNQKHVINGSNIEIAIMGSEKNDKYIGSVLKRFDNPEIYVKTHIIGPDLANIVLKEQFEYKVVNSIKEANEYESKNKIALFNKPGFDRCYGLHIPDDFDYRIAHHCFFNSWTPIWK